MSSTKIKYEFIIFIFIFFWGGEYHPPTHNYCTVDNFNLRNSGKIRKAVDAMSTISRVSPSGKNEPSWSEGPGNDRWIPGYTVHEQRQPDFLQAEEGPQRHGGRSSDA
jgi:hypothetical protein